MPKRKTLEPLIPLDDLKEFVAAIARVPKDAIKKAKAEEATTAIRLKTPRKRKKTKTPKS